MTEQLLNYRRYPILFLLAFATQFLFAQGALKPGYIVKRETGDTVYGFVKKHKMPGVEVEWVDFKLKAEDKRMSYRDDSITAFGYEDIVYRHFDLCGWSRQLEKGEIMLYQGYIPKFGAGIMKMETPGSKTPMASTTSDIPCFVFIKNKRVKTIDNRETMLLQTEAKIGRVLKKETLNNFKEFISDDPEVLTEFLSVDFRFKHIPALIGKYNRNKATLPVKSNNN